MTQDLEHGAAAAQRGPADHNIREQIIAAAHDHFAHYGYGKTTVSDLAKAIGFSKAYIYKFFGSKQEIGNAICTQCVGKISSDARQAASEGRTAAEKYRRFFKSVVETGVALIFNEKKLYDIAAASVLEKWPACETYMDDLQSTLREIILFGRDSGEFERKTPIDETCRVILQVMQPFINPLMLQYNLDLLPEAPIEIANLVLRSLAP
jgi:AcrR family transcriptional regulator